MNGGESMARKRNKPVVTPKQNKQAQKFKRHRKSEQKQPARRTSTSVPPLEQVSTRIKSQPISQSQQDLLTNQRTQRTSLPEVQSQTYHSEIVAQWSDEMRRRGRSDLIDKAYDTYKTTKELEEAIQNGTITTLEKETPIVDATTGEVVNLLETNLNAATNFYTDIIVTTWFMQLESFSTGEAYNFLKNWANDMIAENGKDNFAEMIEKGTADGNFLTWEVVYKTGEAERYISSMLDYLPDQSQLYKDGVQDKFDFYRRMSDAFEQEENWENPE